MVLVDGSYTKDNWNRFFGFTFERDVCCRSPVAVVAVVCCSVVSTER